ncbi:MAG: hypothetical protein KBT06_10755 [Prevotellaceae bacterium]|nr:hypothetical protein [Candidatus Colivivens equi]
MGRIDKPFVDWVIGQEDAIVREYKNWLEENARYLLEPYGCYSKLIEALNTTEFYALIERDENRIADGRDMRRTFLYDTNDYSFNEYVYLENLPVTVLEVLLGLAYRCENTILGDPDYGNRTGEWFYTMLESMNVINYDDYNFDIYDVDLAVHYMLERNYSPDGAGGLFYVPNAKHDMRECEIWHQMHMWINYKFPVT